MHKRNSVLCRILSLWLLSIQMGKEKRDKILFKEQSKTINTDSFQNRVSSFQLSYLALKDLTIIVIKK